MTGLYCALALLIGADESLKGIACRSVHLGYSGKEAIAFYNEVKVRHSAPGTYFCAIGWNQGYFGIQELPDGKKLAIFSVWDNAQGDDPNLIPNEQRVRLVRKGEGVRVGRFGGEGTGGQSFYRWNWDLDQTVAFLVTAKPDGPRMEYSGFLKTSPKDPWFPMVTFSTLSNAKRMSGFYSFVEDFKRDRISTTKTRQALFSNAWLAKASTLDQPWTWSPVTGAKFTADSNPVVNIDARLEGDSYLLATGGEIKNLGTKLKESLPDRKAGPFPTLPPEIPSPPKP